MGKIGAALSKLKLQDALDRKAKPESVKAGKFQPDSPAFPKEKEYSPRSPFRKRMK